MDLLTVDRWVTASGRDDLAALGDPAAAPVAGGTWLFADEQEHLRTLVDLTTMGWEPLTETPDGLEIAATCTIATLLDAAPRWPALAELAPRCAGSLASSPKVWDQATLGGNVCVGLPAGAMISLLVALDAAATVWRPDGTEYDIAVADLVIGVATTSLAPGEVVRLFRVGEKALRSDIAFRRISLATQGRSGAIVVARRDGDGPDNIVLSVTAGTRRPHRLTSPEELDLVDDWHTDHHGTADWRRAMTRRLATDALAALT